LIWVGYNRSLGARMALAGAAMLALSATHYLAGGASMLWLHIVVSALGLMLLLFGFRVTFRRTPMLAGDERGLVASAMGGDRSRIPWELVSGVEVLGAKKADRTLAILTDEPEKALEHVDPVIATLVRKRNRQLGRAAVQYLPANLMGTPAELVAQQIREIIGEPAPAAPKAAPARV
jgi:hypothetical protein